MRTTQYIGHCDKSLNILKNCEKREKIEEIFGMFGEHIIDIFLFYDPKTNKYYREFEQYCPWSSGPMIFLGLKDEEGNEYGWEYVDKGLGEYIDYKEGCFWV